MPLLKEDHSSFLPHVLLSLGYTHFRITPHRHFSDDSKELNRHDENKEELQGTHEGFVADQT